MATTNYTLRVDNADKQRAEQVFKELGMTFATGINIYIKMVSRQQKIPFELALNQQPLAQKANTSEEKKKAFVVLDGILAGHEVDLDGDRDERILSKRK
jgi:DNA-damage-inducible protein J